MTKSLKSLLSVVLAVSMIFGVLVVSNISAGAYASPVCVIVETGNEYPTVQEAVSAADERQTIRLVSDVALESMIYITKKITLDLNGFTIDASEIPEEETNRQAISTNNNVEITSSAVEKGVITGGNGFTYNDATYGGCIVNYSVLDMNNVKICGGTADYGGAVYNQGTFNAANCSFTENQAKNGGAVYSFKEASTLLYNCEISNNLSTSGGGAVYNQGNATYSECTVKNNRAEQTVDENTKKAKSGGAFYVAAGATATFSNCTIQENYGASGGAIYSIGTTTVSSCKITKNTASSGGGIYAATNSTLVVFDSTISENNSTYSTGGVFNYHATVTLKNTKIINNTAANCGGVFSQNGTTVIIDTEISNNSEAAESQQWGGGLCNYGTAVTEIGGNTVISENKSNGNTSNVFGIKKTGSEDYPTLGVSSENPLSENANIGIDCDYIAAGTVMVNNASGNDMQYFVSDNETYCLAYVDGESVIVAQKDINNCAVGEIADQEFTGSEITPEVVIQDEDLVLTKDMDYTVSYFNNTEAGTATIKITGIGDYAGTKEITFVILGDEPEEEEPEEEPEEEEPAEAKDISGCTIEQISDQLYTGSEITPEIVIKDGDKTLVKDTDYTVTYADNTEAGTATVTVNGIGDYTGTTEANFKIFVEAPNTGDNGMAACVSALMVAAGVMAVIVAVRFVRRKEL